MFLSSARNRPNNAMIAKNLLLQNSNGVNFNYIMGFAQALAPFGFKLQRSKF